MAKTCTIPHSNMIPKALISIPCPWDTPFGHANDVGLKRLYYKFKMLQKHSRMALQQCNAMDSRLDG